MHEDLIRGSRLPVPSNRSFSIVFAGLFVVLGLLPLLWQDEVSGWSIAIGAAFLVVGLAAPQVLEQPKRLWMRFAELMHTIVSVLLLTLVFFALVTPTGWIMRAFRNDPMRLKRDPTARTYWIERTPAGPPPDSLKDQF